MVANLVAFITQSSLDSHNQTQHPVAPKEPVDLVTQPALIALSQSYTTQFMLLGMSVMQFCLMLHAKTSSQNIFTIA